jgi:4-amino-4-deoxy-L-arabinose transferase-like glycosyltransferase
MCDIRQIFYDEKDNFYVDDCGYVIPNIYSIIEPNIIYLFRSKKEDMFVYSAHGEYIELIYEPEYEYVRNDTNQIIDRIERRNLA